MNAWDDIDMDEMRAEARMERARLRPHWCSLCHGHTGAGSPCAPEPEEDEDETTD
jgi:hypothetical protein